MGRSPVSGPGVPGGETGGSEYAVLLRRVKEAGLLERRPGRSACGVVLTLMSLAALVAALSAVGDSWWTLPLAVPVAECFVRAAFLGHDAAHQAIARSHRVNRILGLVFFPLVTGVSLAGWRYRHNHHHAHPNDPEKDRNLIDGPLAWTLERSGARRGPAGVLARRQGMVFSVLAGRPFLLFCAAMVIESLWVLLTSVLYLRGRPLAERLVETVLLAGHYTVCVGVLLVCMAPAKAVLFAAVTLVLFGFHIGCAFAPNHKGMPASGRADTDYLRRQVLPTRNVRGGRVVYWLLGGLNYQIEHHLFPGMPRANLRSAQALVRDHCRRCALPYAEAGPSASYAAVRDHLTGAACSALPR
ncbi:fatty acid desaturase family protein [Streptomyces sp. NPDC021100]|uniref:fatty acid desaturase family protein n=1 Tax=Streptomyces sp. NPDC021100 TaxID=3365114 RepID=UPI00378B2A68